MKKVTAFVGSARRKLTYFAVSQLLDNLKSLGGIEYEIIALSHHQLGPCRGCKLCFEKGEEFCPLEDDRDRLFEKMMASDGVVIASPNYSFQVSAITKIFLDRFGFAFHRPRFFGKTFTIIVAQGLLGGEKIVSYLDFLGNGLGFNTVKGCCVTACEPMTDSEKQKIDKTLAEHSRRFYDGLMKPAYPVPTLLKLWVFRMGRTSIRLMLDETTPDFQYWKAKLSAAGGEDTRHTDQKDRADGGRGQAPNQSIEMNSKQVEKPAADHCTYQAQAHIRHDAKAPTASDSAAEPSCDETNEHPSQ